MTYQEYLALIAAGGRPPHWREGQWHFNVLYRNRPALANAVRGGQFDPFHDDTRIPAFLGYIAWMWDEPQ